MKTLFCAALILSLGAATARAAGLFWANEIRAAELRDGLRREQVLLSQRSEPGRTLSAQIEEAFRGADDRPAALQACVSLRQELAKRAAALEAKLETTVDIDADLGSTKTRKTSEDVAAKADVVRRDYELFSKLAALAASPYPQREDARAALRLLAQTRDFDVARAFFQDKTDVLGKTAAPKNAGFIQLGR
jgi:hypothetical protein